MPLVGNNPKGADAFSVFSTNSLKETVRRSPTRSSVWGAKSWQALGITMRIGPIVRVTALLSFMIAGGAYLLWAGWRGWTEGAILVRRKFSPDFMAYAAGPHADAFKTEVWLSTIAGMLLLLLGGGCAIALLTVSTERRESMISAADEAFRSSAHRKGRWLLMLVLLAFCVVLVGALIRNGT